MFSKVRSKSHCAAGKTNDIVVVSSSPDNPAGNATAMRIRLNFPNPDAVIARSKSTCSRISQHDQKHLPNLNDEIPYQKDSEFGRRTPKTP